MKSNWIKKFNIFANKYKYHLILFDLLIYYGITSVISDAAYLFDSSVIIDPTTKVTIAVISSIISFLSRANNATKAI